MLKIIARTALLVVLGLAVVGGPRAQENQADGPRATGLIPLDAAQIEEIVANWPRISRVGLNPLGFERVNEVRAGKGKAPLDSQSVPPVGGEVESALAARAASDPRRPRERGPGRRPAGQRRQQPAEVLPSDPEPGQPRLLRQLRFDLRPAFVHDGVPAQPGHPEPRRQHEQVFAEMDLQHAQRRRRTTDRPSTRTTPSSRSTGPRPGPNSRTTRITSSWCLNPAAWRNALGVRTKADPVRLRRSDGRRARAHSRSS